MSIFKIPEVWIVGLCVFYDGLHRLYEWSFSEVMFTWSLWKISALYKLSNVSDSKDFLAFIIMPIPFAILHEMHLTCSTHFNLLSINIPINLALSTSMMLAPQIWILGRISLFPLGLNSKEYALSIFKDSMLAFSHCMILPSSFFAIAVGSCRVYELKNNVVSSANRIEERIFDTDAISLMYNTNNNGPSMDPCGTPQVIFFIFEGALLYLTY